jgi:hypothetical protein
MVPAELEVLEVNSAFYRAFAARDVAGMEALWARSAPVACIHPGWDALRGREAVMASWRSILGGDAPHMRCTRASAHVLSAAAFVVCHETADGVRLVATNVFVREDGAWRMVHHQAGGLGETVEEDGPEALA